MNDTITPEAAQRRLEERRRELGINPNPPDLSITAAVEKLKEKVLSVSPEVREQHQREYVAAAERALEELFRRSGCPERHQRVSTLDRAGTWGKKEEEISARLGAGFLIALVGTRGSGKTQLAVELIRKRTRDGHRCKFCTAMEFFMDIKAGYRDGGDSEKDVINRYCRPKLLVIDELGKRAETEWESRLLYELINRRYNAVLDTLIISNQDAKELEAALGPSIASRMRETGGVIECNWESYRK